MIWNKKKNRSAFKIKPTVTNQPKLRFIRMMRSFLNHLPFGKMEVLKRRIKKSIRKEKRRRKIHLWSSFLKSTSLMMHTYYPKVSLPRALLRKKKNS